jgi:septal ring factor EnvC (AmiA/AmiB activator)
VEACWLWLPHGAEGGGWVKGDTTSEFHGHERVLARLLHPCMKSGCSAFLTSCARGAQQKQGTLIGRWDGAVMQNHVQKVASLAEARMRAILVLSQKKLEMSMGELQKSKEELQMSKEELQMSKEELQMSKEELQKSMGELQMSKEELQKSKKELQMSKEELQMSKEELQMSKKELQMSKEELQMSKAELEEANRVIEEQKARIDRQDMELAEMKQDEYRKKTSAYSRREHLSGQTEGNVKSLWAEIKETKDLLNAALLSSRKELDLVWDSQSTVHLIEQMVQLEVRVPA